MSLCRLMVMDFMERIGRWDNETGRPRYDRYDLLFGRSYAEGFLCLTQENAELRRALKEIYGCGSIKQAEIIARESIEGKG